MFLGLADNIFVDTPSIGTPGLGWVLQSGGVQATLDIDFVVGRAIASGVISTPASLLTCARATPATATYITAEGFITGFSANTLRYGSNGLLVEEARTNSAIQSSTLNNAAWVANQLTSVTANVIGPDNQANSAYTLVAAGGGNSTITQTLAAADGSIASFFVKAGTSNFAYIQTNDAGGSRRSWFNILTGVVGTTNVSTGAPTIVHSSPAIVALANGWFRVAIRSSGAATTTFVLGMSDADNNTACANGNTIFAVAGQLEVTAATFATSYIPTTTVAVTRAVDAITLNSVVGLVTTGTWVTNFSLMDTVAAHEIIDYSPTVIGTTLILYGTNGGTVLAAWNASNLTALGAASINTTLKAAFNFDNVGNMAGCLNGGTVQSSAASDYTGAATQISIGSRANGSNFPGDCLIKRISFFNTKLSNAAMQSLTT